MPWQLAQTGLLAMLAMRSRIDSSLPRPALGVSLSAGTSAAVAAGRSEEVLEIHLPPTTGDVRFGYDVTASTLP